MSFNNKFCFELTVRSLARVLAQIKPTPWEKVSDKIDNIDASMTIQLQ